MANGFEIQVTEKEFKAKSQDEQNWILFQGISGVSKCIRDIDERGCDYARKKQKGYRIKLASALGAGVAGGMGIIYIIFHLLHHNP